MPVPPCVKLVISKERTSVHITVEISNLIFLGRFVFVSHDFLFNFFLPNLKEYLMWPEECI